MTQDTAHMPLDERGLEAARSEFNSTDLGHEYRLKSAIRAYLQTAAADVSGLARSIDRWRKMVPVAVTAGSPAQIEYALADAKHDIVTLWSTLQTLSASNAALEAENQWQPIDTAPKDGTLVLLFTRWAGDEIHPEPFDEIQIGCWDEGNLTGDIWHREAEWSVDKIGTATHWRPLPAPPAIRALAKGVL